MLGYAMKHEPAPLPELLSAPEVAELLGMSAVTLAIWRSTERGPRWIKVGKRAVRYLRSDVFDFIEAGARDPEARAAA